jgi:hypothetical protein
MGLCNNSSINLAASWVGMAGFFQTRLCFSLREATDSNPCFFNNELNRFPCVELVSSRKDALTFNVQVIPSIAHFRYLFSLGMNSGTLSWSGNS